MNFSRFINSFSALRTASPIRKLTEIQLQGGDNLISLGTGAPNAAQFPFQSITVSTKDGGQFTLENNTINRALQYGPSSGMPELVKWFKTLQVKLHNPLFAQTWKDDGAEFDVLITPGSQDGLSKILEMVLNPGDHFLMEENSYPGTIAALRPYNLSYLKIKCDSAGLRPDSLKQCLSKWKPSDTKDPNCVIPKLLYIQPNYSNPSGATIPLERRLEILEIAKEYDLLIVEDDPYYFLGFEPTSQPSFLSMDTEGRVLRLDSFSKILSSGMRVGFVSGSKIFIERLTLALQVSSMHCSSLSQMLVWQFLDRIGIDGFIEHAKKAADFYASQSSSIIASAEKHLKGLAEWSAPKGGMFLWMRVPGVQDTYEMLMLKGLEKQVVFAPGNMFQVDSTSKSQWIRASFSNVTPAKMDEGFRRLAELIKEEQSDE